MTAVHSTLQSVFNTAWQEFIVNHRPQAMEGGVCLYRGTPDYPGDDNGGAAASNVRCIIGVCIPDDMYDPDLEHNTIGTLFHGKPTWYKRVFNGIEIDALILLQAIHDNDFNEIKVKLTEFAENYNLRIPTQPE